MKVKWTLAEIRMQRNTELHALRHAIRRSTTSHASQHDREVAAEKPLPKYVASIDRKGQSNTGRIWSF